MAILFWPIAVVTGTVGAYDIRPSGLAALPCMVLLLGAVASAGLGLFKSGLRDKFLAGLALLITLVPLSSGRSLNRVKE